MSTPAGGDRPRPQYGEYATYDEQQALIQHAVSAPPRAEPLPAAPRTVDPLPAAPPPGRPPRLADRLATVMMLAFGLVNVASSVPALWDYRTYVAGFLDVLGASGELADPAGAAPWGIAAALVLIVGLIAAAVLSRASLLRGRVTFWIPIAAAVVVNLISASLAIVPIVTDAALWSSIQSALLG